MPTIQGVSIVFWDDPPFLIDAVRGIWLDPNFLNIIKIILILGFTSGYACKNCWSTKPKTDCPCSIEEQTHIPGQSSAFTSGADSHCTGEIELDPNFKNGDQR